MVIKIGRLEYPVKISEYNPSFESGIEWFQVGKRWKYLNKGNECKKWKTEITISDVGQEVSQARDVIINAAKSGQNIYLDCESYEPVFGPEFNYTAPVECVLTDFESDFSTGNLNENGRVEWTFAVTANENMAERYLYITPFTLPYEHLRILSVSRNFNPGTNVIEKESFDSLAGFGFTAPTAEIAFEADREWAAKALAFAQEYPLLAGLESKRVWLFDRFVYESTFNIIEVNYDGPTDKACTMYRFTLLVARV